MPHDCAGPAVSDVTMFGISQVVPAIRSCKAQPLVLADFLVRCVEGFRPTSSGPGRGLIFRQRDRARAFTGTNTANWKDDCI